MSNAVKFYKVTTLPETLEPNAFYLVKEDETHLIVYVTNSTGSVAYHTPTIAEITDIVNTLIGQSNKAFIVNTIAERDALNPVSVVFAYVLDATGDPTVTSGGALYLYNPSTTSWIKVAEFESLDIRLVWDQIEGRPTSTPAQLDDAVAKAHTHTNLASLNKIGEDANGEFQYNGNYVLSRWEAVEW